MKKLSKFTFAHRARAKGGDSPRTRTRQPRKLRDAIGLGQDENLADFGLADNPSILASFELEPLAHAEA